MRTYQPKVEGKLKCIECLLYDNTQVWYYTTYNGPYCQECWESLCKDSSVISGETLVELSGFGYRED